MAIETKGKVSFRGGAHPPESKELTRESGIQPGPVVKEFALLLSQHTGALCRPLVQPNDRVKAADKVGGSDAFVSAPVHSPVNGKVKEIALRSHPILGRSPAVIIEADPDFDQLSRAKSVRLPDRTDYRRYSSEDICEAVFQAGIVGMGGAGFPTRVKIEPNPRLPKDTMIINGCECEPYVTCDYRLMYEQADKIIIGVKLARKASGCSKVLIGIEDNKPGAINSMEAAVRNHADADNISVIPVKTKYPQGSERQLIKAILKKDVPTAGIPPMIGVLVLNVATVAAIAEAVLLNLPLTHRVVTVTGEGINNPGNYYVGIGTPIAELIQFCGGLTAEVVRVIIGGPMTGIAIADLTTPVMKTTGAITILTKKQVGEARFARHRTACIHCGRCLEVCPENLHPTMIAHAVRKNRLDVAEKYYIVACTECGCCSYVCPANIELTGHIKTGKMFLARQKQRIPQ